MKRSNKLLTGLLIAIFIVPLGLFMAFKRMVKEDNYTAIHNKQWYNNKHYIASEKTGHYSVVKIAVPKFKNTDSREILSCHLHSSTEGHYYYRKFDIMDSISITNERDTLFIRYVIKPHQKSTPTYFVHYNIDLYLPDMKDIVVDGATLQIDSVDAVANPDIGIHLTDAIFQLGDGVNKEDSNKPLKELQEAGPDKKESPAVLKYSNLSVSAGASQLIFGYHLQIDTLSLDIGRNSELTIANDFQAHEISGAISRQATIVSDIRTIKMLSGLNSR